MRIRFITITTTAFLGLLGSVPFVAMGEPDREIRIHNNRQHVRLLTGPSGPVNHAIASGTDVEITLQPVDPRTLPATAYPPGSSIVDQTLSLSSVPARIWVDVLVTGWSPQMLGSTQVTISASDSDMDGGGYSGANAVCSSGGPSNAGDLTPAMQPCNTSTDCRNQISGISGSCPFGEPSRCATWDGFEPGGYFPAGKFCEPGYMNRCDTRWMGSGVSQLSAVDLSNTEFRFGIAVSPDEIATDFLPSYLGTIVLDVPADAGGSYTIDMDELNSFVQTQSFPPGNDIPIALYRSAIIETPCGPLADPTGLDKTRFISFSANSAVAGNSAIRVTLLSLHHVDPPYTGGPSIPFTAFEFGENCEEAGGCVRWVGPPTQYMESTTLLIPFYASQLQCTPHYQDWGTVGLLHVTGSAIVPSSYYEVVAVDASCAGNETGCTAVSEPLIIKTTRWGDVEEEYNPPATTVQPDFTDISELVTKFRNSPAPKARLLLAGLSGDPYGEITHQVLNVDVNFSHISACVNAFRGVPYPYIIRACP